ncbi:hypothetical protein IWZ00DRAFT_563543 [Phyllosticta capitalensis]|uniref:Uncharacterized protein n=1 Tax=Phyllosticta capitalensis TaxID=121624 RepID=A0ABR1YFD3_9PEZI
MPPSLVDASSPEPCEDKDSAANDSPVNTSAANDSAANDPAVNRSAADGSAVNDSAAHDYAAHDSAATDAPKRPEMTFSYWISKLRQQSVTPPPLPPPPRVPGPTSRRNIPEWRPSIDLPPLPECGHDACMCLRLELDSFYKVLEKQQLKLVELEDRILACEANLSEYKRKIADHDECNKVMEELDNHFEDKAKIGVRRRELELQKLRLELKLWECKLAPADCEDVRKGLDSVWKDISEMMTKMDELEAKTEACKPKEPAEPAKKKRKL